MKKSERKIQVFSAEEIGIKKWIEIKKKYKLRPAPLYSVMGPQWCDLWILKFNDGRIQNFRQF